MDRSTVTANLKPLERQGLVRIEADPEDRRGRRIALTDAGLALLAAATPIWTREHAAIEATLGWPEQPDLRSAHGKESHPTAWLAAPANALRRLGWTPC
jgi:DNA-binding MarR family transcriptional regulator